MKRYFAVAVFACVLGMWQSADAACPKSPPNNAFSNAARLDTQTSDAVNITGGCISGVSIGQTGTDSTSFAAGLSAGGALASPSARNVAIGTQALAAGTNVPDTVAIGYQALDALTTYTPGGGVVAIGSGALGSMLGTSQLGGTVAVGYQAGFACTTCTENTYIGFWAGKVDNASHETVVGHGALLQYSGALGSNTAIGGDSMRNVGQNSVQGSGNNTAIGEGTIKNETTGAVDGVNSTDNTAIGANVMRYWSRTNNNSAGNTAVGKDAYQGSVASRISGAGATLNVALGYQAMKNATTAGSNIVIGANAAGNTTDDGGGLTTGTNNIYIGKSVAGDSTNYTGSNNIIIGTNAEKPAAAGTSNTLSIEDVIKATGTNTPTSSVTTIAGLTQLGNGAGVAVASLPTCNSGTKGAMTFITDANSTTYNATAAGGGANIMPVFCNGTNWTLH